MIRLLEYLQLHQFTRRLATRRLADSQLATRRLADSQYSRPRTGQYTCDIFK